MPQPKTGLIRVDMEVGEVFWHVDCKLANMGAFLHVTEGIDNIHYRDIPVCMYRLDKTLFVKLSALTQHLTADGGTSSLYVAGVQAEEGAVLCASVHVDLTVTIEVTFSNLNHGTKGGDASPRGVKQFPG